MQMNRNKTEKRKNMWNGMVKPQDGWLVFDRSKNELAHERATRGIWRRQVSVISERIMMSEWL